MNRQTYDALVERLEAQAKRNPTGYRFKVLGWIGLGYGTVFALIAALLAVIAAIAFIAFSLGLGLVSAKLAKLGFVLLPAVWVLARSLWVKVDPPQGLELRQSDAPELFAMVERIRKELRVPRVKKVLLTSDFNAAVSSVPVAGLLPLYRSYLVLGLPLMQSLTPAEFEAVVAHEFGHLSKSHGKLGSWIYRARQGWFQLAAELGQADALGSGMAQRFVGWYAPRFGAVSFVLAREQEYEADAASAQVTSPQTAADALVRLNLMSDVLDEDFWPAVTKLADEHPEPPDDIFARQRAKLGEHVPADRQQRLRSDALRRYTDTSDTHPSLSDRLAALGGEARELPALERSAFDAYLGARGDELARDLGAEWRATVKDSWKELRKQNKAAAERLAELDAKAAEGPLSEDDAFEHLHLQCARRDGAEQLPLVEAFLEAYPDHTAGRFRKAAILLDEEDERGVELMEQIAGRGNEVATAAYGQLAAFFTRRGDRQRADAYIDRVESAGEQAHLDRMEMVTISIDDELTAHTYSDEQYALFEEKVLGHYWVERAWLVRKFTPRNPDETLHVLFVEVPGQKGLSEEEREHVCDRRIDDIVGALPDELQPLLVLSTLDADRVVKHIHAIAGAYQT